MRERSDLKRPLKPSRSLRILIVSSDIVDENLFVAHYSGIYAALAMRGHNVTWVAARTSPFVHAARVPGFKLETQQTKKVPFISLLSQLLFALWRLIRSSGCYDAVVVGVLSTPVAFLILAIDRLAFRRPVAFLRITSNPQETGGHLRTLLWYFVDALSAKLAAGFFDKIFFISPLMAEMYAAKFDIPRDKIAVWPSGVDTALFFKRSTQSNYLRKELGRLDQPKIIYHGYISKARGILETAQAFKILKEESVRATLIVLGDGPGKEELCDYVLANRLEDVVQVLGPVDYHEIPDYIAACDAGIVPLPDHVWFRYQCPIKLLEYLAMSKPVIVSGIPANRWVLGSAPVASYLDGTRPDEIARGIKKFLESKNSLRPELGPQIAARFSTERIAESIERHILSVMERDCRHAEKSY
jgi:glycosyltransferase involved in cell wall biosynthesis